MSNSAVAIVTDSAAALSPADISRFKIAVVPLRLRVDGTLFHEGVNISPPRVVAELTAGKRVEVLEPTAEEIGKAYRQASYTGARGIVSVHLAAAMHDAAAQARAAAASAGVDVRVLDTGTVAMAQGLVALAAAAVAATGAGIDEVEEAARRTASTARLMFVADRMDYLHRDKQMNGMQKAICHATGVHPMLEVVNGDVVVGKKIRGTAEARIAVKEAMAEYAATLANPGVVVSLIGGSAAEEGLLIDVTGAHAEASPGASLTAHSGPGTYVVAVADMPACYTP